MNKMLSISRRWQALLLLIFLLPAGCKKDPAPTPEPPGGFDPRDVPVTANAKIESGGSQYEWIWEEGEFISVFTTGKSTNSNIPFELASVSASGTSGLFSGTIRQTDTGSHIFSAAYPYYDGAATDPAKYVVEIPSVQNITSGGIDPSTYLLVGKPVERNIGETGNVSLGEMKFSSPLAIVRLDFTNEHPYLAGGETITGIRFSAGSGRTLAGKAYYDITAERSSFDVFSSGNTVIDALYPENAGPEAGTGFTGWFTSFPFEIAAGGTYSITLTTDQQTLTGSVTTDTKISFTGGVLTALRVTIDDSFESDIPIVEQWGRIDLASDINEGDYVIAAYNYATAKWMAMSTAVTGGNPPGIEITLSDDEAFLTDDPAGNTVWNLTGNNTAGFSVSSTVPSHLGATDEPQGLSISSSDQGVKWTFSDHTDYGLLMKGTASSSRALSLYYSVSAGYDWRYYIPSTVSNLHLFKEGVAAPAPKATVTSGAVSGVSLSGATLNGSYIHPSATAESAGFACGTSSSSLADIPATLDGGSFSATLDGLPQGTRYYYRAFVVVDGMRYEGSLKSFRTALPGPEGKTWAELPDVLSGEDMIAKTYYETMADGMWGRNYSVLYDPSMKVSLWVAYPMHADTHLGDIPRNQLEKWSYDNDGDIPVAYQAAIASGSYKENTYHRGHQMASNDRNGVLLAGRQSYYPTNMTPQNSSLNSGAWSTLESAIRSVAKASTTPAQDTLYIVTGPLMTTRPPSVFATDTANESCPVPDGYFKVILWSKYIDGTRSYDSVGFLFENRSYAGTSYTAQAVSVSTVEGQTGYSFFDNLGLSPAEMSAIKSTSTWSSFSSR